MIWEQKTKRVFRVLSQAEVEKLMPTDEDIANLPPETTSPPVCPVSSSPSTSYHSPKGSTFQIIHSWWQTHFARVVRRRDGGVLEEGAEDGSRSAGSHAKRRA